MNVPGVALGNHLGVFHAQKHSLWLVVAGKSYETVQGTLFTKNHETLQTGFKIGGTFDNERNNAINLLGHGLMQNF